MKICRPLCRAVQSCAVLCYSSDKFSIIIWTSFSNVFKNFHLIGNTLYFVQYFHLYCDLSKCMNRSKALLLVLVWKYSHLLAFSVEYIQEFSLTSRHISIFIGSVESVEYHIKWNIPLYWVYAPLCLWMPVLCLWYWFAKSCLLCFLLCTVCILKSIDFSRY